MQMSVLSRRRLPFSHGVLELWVLSRRRRQPFPRALWEMTVHSSV
jgi:hypothetical protein